MRKKFFSKALCALLLSCQLLFAGAVTVHAYDTEPGYYTPPPRNIHGGDPVED